MTPDRYSPTCTDVRDRPTWEPLAVAIVRARGGEQAGEIARHVLEGQEDVEGDGVLARLRHVEERVLGPSLTDGGDRRDE